MKKPPFIKLYVKDFAFDTQELSNEELGAYMRSFLKAYKSGKICKKDEQESLFFELKNSMSSYDAVCRKNKNNRLKSNSSNNESSTSRQPVVDHSVNHKPITKNHKPITNNQKNKTALRPEYISEEVWSDFLNLRKRKKAPLTETALNGISREANKAGYILEDALRECCSRGWAGFKAEWVKNETKGKSNDRTESTAQGLVEWMESGR